MSDFIDAVLEVFFCFTLGLLAVHLIVSWF